MTAETSVIYLQEIVTGNPIQAELRDAIETANLIDWQTHWLPALFAIMQSIPPTQWPQSWHWNWRQKVLNIQGLLGNKGASVTCQGVTQGLMLVDLTRAARLPDAVGKPMVYVDYLEVAPWNWSGFSQSQRYKGVGLALMTDAVMLSDVEGFKGRLGLHSLPQSEKFYRDRCKMTDLGPDAAYGNLRYFEMNAEQAQAFIGKEDGK